MIQLIFTCLIAIAILSLPILIFLLKATKYGAKLTLIEAGGLLISRNARKKLLMALAVSQKEQLGIDLPALEAHLIVKGDPYLLMKALLNYKTHPVIDYQLLAGYDIAHHNLEQILEKGIPEYHIKFDDFPIRNFKLNYSASFLDGFEVPLNESKVDKITDQIKQKLMQFGLNSDFENPDKMSSFIKSTVLNDTFWTAILGVTMVEQNIELNH